jgi:hypothetical protein
MITEEALAATRRSGILGNTRATAMATTSQLLTALEQGVLDDLWLLVPQRV